MKLLFSILLIAITHLAIAQLNKTYLFVGTYTNGKPNNGIYIYEFNEKTGGLKLVNKGKNITNPSFLTVSANGSYIYACTDTKLPNAGSVSAFKFDSLRAKLTFINKQPSGGENPVYITTNKNDELIINANYTEGTISVFTSNPNGSLNPYKQLIKLEGSSINKVRQDKAHVHAAVFSPDFNYLFFPDLGSDKIRVFKVNLTDTIPLKAEEKLDFTAIAGSGPRHFTFHPNQKFAYCIDELSGTVTAFKYQNGKLDSIQKIFSYSQLQEEYNSADIHISPDGLFLYASNRLDDENTISIFAINQLNGKLTLIHHQPTYGNHPRNFTLDATGNFLIVANQLSNSLVVFKRNLKTGLLTKTGKTIHVPRPSCLKMKTYGTTCLN